MVVMENIIKIYPIFSSSSKMNITPTTIKRDWMSANNNHAYSCIPMNVANQYGWTCHSMDKFTATWDGGSSVNSIKIESNYNKEIATSHFADGILTVLTDFVIKTPKNISIYVRGITNSNKPNIYPLDGIVETDWLPFTFTMNYKFHTPGSVTFEKDEPLFMFFPIERKFIEKFKIEQNIMNSNPELFREYKKYQNARKQKLQGKSSGKQKFYLSGKVVDEKKNITNHQSKLNLHNPNIDLIQET